ncbi:MAG: hypothetical protein KGK08_00375 [Acidobacteriota bacterium]|nr:hypothetical protein [Acidobacteriota bacterium]
MFFPSLISGAATELAMVVFADKPWAKQAAITVIVVALSVAAALLIIRANQGALDPPEIAIVALLLLAIIPPNIAILRAKPSPSAAARARGLRGER